MIMNLFMVSRTCHRVLYKIAKEKNYTIQELNWGSLGGMAVACITEQMDLFEQSSGVFIWISSVQHPLLIQAAFERGLSLTVLFLTKLPKY